jgi:hypothetical protein
MAVVEDPVVSRVRLEALFAELARFLSGFGEPTRLSAEFTYLGPVGAR